MSLKVLELNWTKLKSAKTSTSFQKLFTQTIWLKKSPELSNDACCNRESQQSIPLDLLFTCQWASSCQVFEFLSSLAKTESSWLTDSSETSEQSERICTDTGFEVEWDKTQISCLSLTAEANEWASDSSPSCLVSLQQAPVVLWSDKNSLSLSIPFFRLFVLASGREGKVHRYELTETRENENEWMSCAGRERNPIIKVAWNPILEN